MAIETTPDTVMVPVKKYKVDLTLDDLLTPLVQLTATQATLSGGAAPHPELARNIEKLSELAAQLKETVNEINRLHPAMLAPRAQPR